jgi:DNA-directed RNA polymerase alpha subunit
MYNVCFKRLEADNLELELKGFDISMINGLRRILIAEVPSLAIDTIKIHKNDSIMVDEILIHRLGLIVLKCPFEIECVNVSLNLHCEDDTLSVTSNHLVFSDKNVSPFSKNIEIVKLRKGQSLFFEGKAIRGIGRDNVKWSPVIVVSFKKIEEKYYIFNIETNNSINIHEILLCAIKILKEKVERLRLSVENIFGTQKMNVDVSNLSVSENDENNLPF